jgi:hypothetical protein
MKTESWPQAKRTWGDAAVDGLLGGVAAGLVMAVYVLVVGMLMGAGWEAVLAQFDPGANPAPLTGALTHLAVAGVYGAVFGLGWRALHSAWPRLPALLIGLAYGGVLWGLAAVVTSNRPSGEWLRALPAVHLAVAHLLYGAVLGVAIRRLHH